MATEGHKVKESYKRSEITAFYDQNIIDQNYGLSYNIAGDSFKTAQKCGCFWLRNDNSV